MTESDRSSVVNGLRVAAEVYRADAAKMRGFNMARVADEFEAQSVKALRLAARFEAGEN